MEALLETLQLHAGQLEILPSGYHTKVTLIIHNGQHSVVKMISKREFVNREVAEILASDLRQYHALLRESGVLVPDLDRIELLPSQSGHDIVLIVPFHGYDAERRLELGELGSMEILEGVLVALRPLLSGHERFELRIGIDPKPSNFVSTNGANFHYVDWMPPRFRKNGHPLVEFNDPSTPEGQKLAYFRSYDVRGILLVLQSQLSKLDLPNRQAIKRRIAAFADEVAPGAGQYLRNLASEKFHRVAENEARRMVSRLGPGDLYQMREIACELASQDRVDGDFLREVFHLTHFFDDLPEKACFEKAKQLVTNAILKR